MKGKCIECGAEFEGEVAPSYPIDPDEEIFVAVGSLVIALTAHHEDCHNKHPDPKTRINSRRHRYLCSTSVIYNNDGSPYGSAYASSRIAKVDIKDLTGNRLIPKWAIKK